VSRIVTADEGDQSRSVLANMVGNSTQDMAGIGRELFIPFPPGRVPAVADINSVGRVWRRGRIGVVLFHRTRR
jgi:hypothetical protein